jgi:thiamine-monophosphate kinase
MPSSSPSPGSSSQPSPNGDLAGPPRGELAWIERIRQRAAIAARGSGALRLGIGDDCAILSPPRGHEIVLTTDMSLEGRHFRRDWHPPAAVGHRALARGLSDLAAMGARPLAAFLSLAIPRDIATEATWVEGFLDGLLALAAATKTPLAGGDTAEAACSNITIDIVLLGATPTGRALRRTGAQPGDRIFVTGALGGSAAELAALSTPAPAPAAPSPKSRTPHSSAGSGVPSERRLLAGVAERMGGAHSNGDHPHLFPQPRLAAGQSILRRRLATACIDLSDGLSTDLAHLCTASNVAAEIETARLPLHPLTRTQTPEAALDLALHWALHGGEDYELLFTAPPSASVPRAIAGVPLTCIGEIRRAGRNRPLMTLIGPDGTRTPLEPGGWEHLK